MNTDREAMTYMEQEEILLEHVMGAKDYVISCLSGISEDDILPRFKEGYRLYGDTIFHSSSGGLNTDIQEELIDAIVYAGVLLYKNGGEA